MGEQAANTEHPKEPEERSLGNAQNFSHTYCAFCGKCLETSTDFALKPAHLPRILNSTTIGRLKNCSQRANCCMRRLSIRAVRVTPYHPELTQARTGCSCSKNSLSLLV